MKPKKNKKRNRDRSRPNATFPASYLLGSRVRVKSGTTVPDFRDIPLGGWVGTIVELDQRSNPPTYLIEWDKHTLDHMHPVYRNRCERDGLTLESMWLAETDLELNNGGPVVIEQPTHLVTRPLSKHDPEDRIRAIFALTSDDALPPANSENVRRYARYLATQLSFPFQAEIIVEPEPFTLKACPITVVGLLGVEDCDEEDGVLCKVERPGQSTTVPLAALEMRKRSQQCQLVHDYSYWFANWSVEEFATSVGVPPLLFDDDNESASVGKLLGGIVLVGLFGAIYGAVLGSLLGVVEGTLTGVLVGAGILGSLGLMVGSQTRPLDADGKRIPYGSLTDVILGSLGGVLSGGMIGAMVVAFAGTLLGVVLGALLGGVLRRFGLTRINLFGTAVFGAVVGAVVLAYYRDHQTALLWATHGLWVGGIPAMFLMLGLSLFLRSGASQRWTLE